MRLSELRSLLQELKDKGYIPSERTGPTGIGHTLESQLGIAENNMPLPDIGGVFEVKATRANTNNLITLFTFNRGAWRYSYKEIIEGWGYVDENGRSALYTTVSALEDNSLGFQLVVPNSGDQVALMHIPSETLLGSWSMEYIVETFVSKLGNMLLVHADSRHVSGKEMFHFNRAHLLSEPNSTSFKDSFAAGVVTIDIRMHIRANGTSRNHGTGFRIFEHNMHKLYGSIDRLM